VEVVESAEIFEIYGAGDPAFFDGAVEFPVEIPDFVKCEAVTVLLNPASAGPFCFPRAVVGGADAEPREEDDEDGDAFAKDFLMR